MNKNFLYIPLEIYRRELNGMLLLALVAAKRGWSVIIGGKKSLFPVLADFPQGTVLLKSIVPGEVDLQKTIKSNGHKITSIDAEGLLPSNGRSGVDLRYSEKSIEESDLVFFWGDEQYSQVEKYLPIIKKCGFVTGSPIFDYWKLLRSEKKKQERGDCKTILIATSFPYPNHYIDREMSYASVKSASGSGATDEHLKEIFLDGELQDFIYPQFKSLVESIITSYPEVRVILRPHPAENPTPWEDFSKYRNVKMSRSGDISPLLLESDILIHFNSTTSIEAHYYGVDVITFVPDELPSKLYNRLNKQALLSSVVSSSNDDLLKKVGSFLQGQKFEVSLKLDNLIRDCHDERISSSSENILGLLEELSAPGPKKGFPSRSQILFNKKAIYSNIRLRLVWLAGWIDHLTRLFSGRYSSQRNIFKYGLTKQGHLSLVDFQNKARELAKGLDLEIADFKIEKLKNGLFKVEREQK